MGVQLGKMAKTVQVRSIGFLASIFLVALIVPAIAAGPVLHEYFVPSPGEDLELGARTAGGRVPAAIPGQTVPIPAPDVNRDPYSTRTTYGGATDAGGAETAYKIDRTTSRPSSVDYHEPFIPSIAPFKRQFAYDAVDANLELTLRDKTLQSLVIGGLPEPGEDQFYGDLAVELIPNTAVRIPSVGPGTRVLAANASPEVPFQLFRDLADNWFVKSNTRQRVRLILQLAIDRRVFGSPFAETSFELLNVALAPVPEEAKRAAVRVGKSIGLTDGQSPREMLEILVQYFRSFVPSKEYPDASSGVALYEELSLSQKGVCRHRAYSFVITALAHGIPSRMVRNEAHAWVEVFDGDLWHRVDLGGAADRVDIDRESQFEPYRNPRDPFAWPDRAESGQEMVARAFGANPGAASRSPTQPKATSELAAVGAPNGVDSSGASVAAREKSKLSAQALSARVLRGHTLRIRGRLQSSSGSCPQARVDVHLAAGQKERIFVQSFATDSEGRFDQDVTISIDVPVGPYAVLLSSPGTLACAPVRME